MNYSIQQSHINMEKKKALLWLFLFFSAFLFRLSASSSRSFNSIADQVQYSSTSTRDIRHHFQVALGIREEKELFRERRMDIETRDYSGTGANNHHDPKPPGSF